MTYQLTSGDTIVRLADNAFIPQAPGNRDYAEYLEWLAEGNEPLPYIPPTVIDGVDDLATAKGIASDSVRTDAYTKLQPTDWVVVREMETGVASPEPITTYRTAIRDVSAEKISTIESKTNIETLATYLRSEEFASWPEPPTV